MSVVGRERVARATPGSTAGLATAEQVFRFRAPERALARPVAAASERNAALDGLRFVAVAGVLAFHLRVSGAQAGFLGVDLFFVLSGFLITSILLRQVEDGTVRLADFWTRRVRRLAPAVVLALAAVIAWGALAASMTARDDVRGDITATLAYVANWHFISASSYFQATGDQSVLLHMWSLAVEEQFYVLWPLTLFIVAHLAPRRARLPVVALFAVSGVLVSAWRLQSLWLGPESSDRAYMGTDSRVFGPLAGAVVAVLVMRAPRLGAARVPNATLLLLGASILVWSMFALGSADGPSDAYPGGGALLFAAGSAAVIWALAARASPASTVLSLAPVAYLGRISYGIYIWHWPLIVWAQRGWMDMSGISTAPRMVTLTLATIAVASLSYHLVEKPVRYGAIGRHLRGRAIVVVLPVVLCSLIAINNAVVVPHAGAEIAQGKPRMNVTVPAAKPPAVTKTIVLVGDSVPQALGSEFADAAAKYHYVVIRATAGGCPATAVTKVMSTGERFESSGGGCPKVAKKQDTKIRQYRPALVIWWSRYEVAPRLGPDGKVLPLGSSAYWREQEASFAARVRALTRRGARVVTVQIEPPGPALATRNPSERYFLVGQTLLHRRDVVQTWNTFLARHRGPRVFSISIDRLVCHDEKVPCDDALPSGDTARPDGVHYSDAAGRRLTTRILAQALRITRLAP